jgi:hypothetical protein
MLGVFQDHGIRFEYPPDWEVEVTDDGPGQTTVALSSPGGTAFALVRLDEDRPAPAELADEALAAMREEYPSLEASPAMESIDGHHAIGHDVEFLSLDIANTCHIRCFRTDRRTVLVFGQWSDLDGEEPEGLMAALRQSMEETDADDLDD